MKHLITSSSILLLTLNLSAQNEYLSLTPIRFERNVLEISEGKIVKIKFAENVHKPAKGNLEITDDAKVIVGGDTIILNSIKKIIFRNSKSDKSGKWMTAGGLLATIGGTIWLSSITLSEDSVEAAFQVLGGMLLVGVITYGVIFATVGITTMIRGKAYKTYGNHGYHLSIVNSKSRIPISL